MENDLLLQDKHNDERMLKNACHSRIGTGDQSLKKKHV